MDGSISTEEHPFPLVPLVASVVPPPLCALCASPNRWRDFASTVKRKSAVARDPPRNKKASFRLEAGLYDQVSASYSARTRLSRRKVWLLSGASRLDWIGWQTHVKSFYRSCQLLRASLSQKHWAVKLVLTVVYFPGSVPPGVRRYGVGTNSTDGRRCAA